MEKIFIHNGRIAIYCNSEAMERLLLERGDRELSSEECVEYGIAGFEKYVTPQNTVVNKEGSITFTAPTQEEILGPVREDKLRHFDNVMKEIDGELTRSLSDLVIAMLAPAPEDAIPDEEELEKSKTIFVNLRSVQKRNRALRAQVQTAQSIEDVQGIEPVIPDLAATTATF